jgi:hypothetical protein
VELPPLGSSLGLKPVDRAALHQLAARLNRRKVSQDTHEFWVEHLPLPGK